MQGQRNQFIDNSGQAGLLFGNKP